MLCILFISNNPHTLNYVQNDYILILRIQTIQIYREETEGNTGNTIQRLAYTKENKKNNAQGRDLDNKRHLDMFYSFDY